MVSRGRCDAAYAARSTDPQDNRSTVVTAGSDTGLAAPGPARAGGRRWRPAPAGYSRAAKLFDNVYRSKKTKDLAGEVCRQL
jgi:hypothetical protein